MYSMRLHHVPMLASMCVNVLGFVNSGGNAFFSNLFPVLQEVVFREDSEKNSLAQRSCFGVQGGCFLSSLSEGTHFPRPLPFLSIRMVPILPALPPILSIRTILFSLSVNWSVWSYGFGGDGSVVWCV